MEIAKAILFAIALWSAHFGLTSLLTIFLTSARNTIWFLLWAAPAGYGVWTLLLAAKTPPESFPLPDYALAGPATLMFIPAVIAAALRLLFKADEDKRMPDWPFLVILSFFPLVGGLFLLGLPIEELIESALP